MERSFQIIVLIDIVGSTKLAERVGDVRVAEIMRVYDRIFRGLLIKWSGREIDKTDGALLLFESMEHALRYVTEYHRLVEQHLKLQSRVGIHCGHVVMRHNSSAYIERGAKPVEVDGAQKSVTARIMSVARGGQTLMSKRAGEYASSVRGSLVLRDVGAWKLKGVERPVSLYAVGADPARLQRPRETDKARLVRRPRLTRAERVRRAVAVLSWPVGALSLYAVLAVLAFLERAGQLDTAIWYGLYWAVQGALRALVSLLSLP